MKRSILILIVGVFLISFNVHAQDDVYIDGSGNVETGASNTNANLEVFGSSTEDAILGSVSATGAAGVFGENTGSGTFGFLGYDSYGVYGYYGSNEKMGYLGSALYGVYGEDQINGNYGYLGSLSNGVYGFSSSGNAGYFEGNVTITGSLNVTEGITGYSETDPVFAAWDKSTGISITESQVSDLAHFTTADETDPQVGTIGLNFVPKWNGLTLSTGSIFDNGNVGIGTISPGYKLDILSSGYNLLRLSTSIPNAVVRLTGSGTGGGGFNINSSGGANYLSFETGTVEKMRITSSGNVGIGTTSPGQKLTVAGTIESTLGGIRFPDGTSMASINGFDSDTVDTYHASDIIAAAADEVRTPISACGATISISGSYYITGNLTTTGTCITVTADDVSIDLMGFVLSGDGIGNTDAGIYINNVSNVEIKNGTVTHFFYGIYSSGAAASSNRVINVRAMANDSMGILLSSRNNLIRDCTVAGNSIYGIQSSNGSIVMNNTAYNNQNGILAILSTLTNNIAYSNQYWGIYAGTGSRVVGNTVNFNNTLNLTGMGGLYVESSSYVKGNSLSNNYQNNMYVSFADNIIEENLVLNSTNGINFNTSGNFYANNRASGNTTNYVGAAGQTDGGGNYSF